jgi:hypothetical protein
MLLRIMFALCLTSCSVNYHLNKAIKKGYRCDTISDTIRVTKVDSFLIVKHDTTYWVKTITSKDTIIYYKTSYYPKTRFETRFDYKRFNDSLRTIRLMYKDSLQSALKTAKNDLKRERVVQRNKPMRQFKTIFIILGFFLSVFFLIILVKKGLL